MVINHNVSSLNTLNKLNANTKATQNSLEKLSSGLKINSASDDAAGLAISQKMQAQINGLDQASSNAQNGISLIQTAEGGMGQIQTIMQRMNTLANESANGTNDGSNGTDRTAMNSEFTALSSEIDRIANSTQFNGSNILNGNLNASIDQNTTNSTALSTASVNTISESGLGTGTWTIAKDAADDGGYTLTSGTTTLVSNIAAAPAAGQTGTISFGGLNGQSMTINVNDSYAKDALDGKTVAVTGTGSLTLQIGANSGDSTTISIGDMRTSGSGSDAALTALGTASISTQAGAQAALTTVQTAIDDVSAQRASLGADQNRLQYTINNLSTESQNLTSASSQITDVDMAAEMTNFTKNNILTQAANAMLAQANQLPQGVLSLLK
jgi:flagellin